MRVTLVTPVVSRHLSSNSFTVLVTIQVDTGSFTVKFL